MEQKEFRSVGKQYKKIARKRYRLPRKKKKKAKKWLARLRGDTFCYIKRLRYNYTGTFYWVK